MAHNIFAVRDQIKETRNCCRCQSNSKFVAFLFENIALKHAKILIEFPWFIVLTLYFPK